MKTKTGLGISALLFLLTSVNGQIARWTLNNNANDVAGVINGTLLNTPVFSTDGKEGSHSVLLNGSNQYIDFGNPTGLPAGTNARSISVWAKSQLVTSSRSIVSYGTASTGKSMGIGQNGTTLTAGSYNDELTYNTFWTVGVWHHICLTYDGSIARLYADGIEVASSAKTWNITLARTYIGRSVNNNFYWNGNVDDVRIYNTALTASQVLALATLPTSPSALTVASTLPSSVTLNWTDASSNETGFQVERSLTSGSGFVLVNTTAANTGTFTDTGLTPQTVYYYRVRAVNDDGNSDYSTQISATTPIQSVPAAPTGLTAATGVAGTINLSWTDASNNETGFQVERSLTTGTGFTLVTTTAANVVSYFNTGLPSNTAYFYRIRAVNAAGNSSFTAEATATTLPGIPVAPTSLVATVGSSSVINLSWTDGSTNETAFEIERSLTSGSGFTLVSTTLPDASSFSDAGLTPATIYYYRVRSKNIAGSSSYTNIASATTADTPPLAPSQLVSVASTSSIVLSWKDNSTNETEFLIERSLTSGTGFTQVGFAPANSITYSDPAVNAGTIYYYRIRSRNGIGSSEFTGEVNTTILIAGITQLCKGLFCDSNGAVGVGTQIIPAGYRMSVKGKVIAEGMKVDLQSAWPDYVFDPTYKLPEIASLKKYIDTNKHLPNIPSSAEIQKEGMDVANINIQLLEKIEELTLYLIRMEEGFSKVEERMKDLEKENKELKDKIQKR